MIKQIVQLSSIFDKINLCTELVNKFYIPNQDSDRSNHLITVLIFSIHFSNCQSALYRHFIQWCINNLLSLSWKYEIAFFIKWNIIDIFYNTNLQCYVRFSTFHFKIIILYQRISKRHIIIVSSLTNFRIYQEISNWLHLKCSFTCFDTTNFLLSTKDH